MATTLFPKLSLLPENGGAPSIMNFTNKTTFKKKFMAYQYVKGYDVVVSQDTANEVALGCTTDGCSFRISITPKSFPASATKPATAGWRIDALLPDHSHAAPYEPLDLDAENPRRAVPLPMSYTPPRVAVTTARPPSPPPNITAPAPLPPSETAFATFLRSIDPTLIQYIPDFATAGFLDVDLVEVLKFNDTEIDDIVKDMKGLPYFARVEFKAGLRIARERASKNEAGAGSLGTPGEFELAQATAWIEARFAAPRP